MEQAEQDALSLFDAHCHLQDYRLGDQGDAALASAQQSGVRHFSVNGTHEEDWHMVRELAQRHAGAVIPNFGLHPWWVGGASDGWLGRLQRALEADPAAGLGECGLDKAHGGADMATQEAAFRDQLVLGQEMKRPISVHCVRAFGKLLEIIQELGPFPAGIVLHSWAGPAEMVAPFSKIDGVYFSISGHLTHLKTDKAAATVQQIPLERLLLETDAPDGLPCLSGAKGYDADLAQRVSEMAGGGATVLVLPQDPEHRGQESDSGIKGQRQWRCKRAKVPLDWQCPLDVQLQGGPQCTVQHPWQLLNTPDNIWAVLHLLAALRDQKAEHIAAATFANAQRLYGFGRRPAKRQD